MTSWPPKRNLFDTGSAEDDTTLTAAQYAIGLETVLTNVTLDFVWLAGEESDRNADPDRHSRGLAPDGAARPADPLRRRCQR